MNNVCISGTLLNIPRYDVIPSTSDAILRILLNVDGTVLPVVFCNEMANYAWPLLQTIPKGGTVFVAGALKGNAYTDAIGLKKYLLYLTASGVAQSHSDLLMAKEIDTPLAYQGLPFNVSDLEDILKYMEN